ncbi:MAG: hypothetical protein ACXWL2_04300 [Candidatus Chromulinivorax sp.]
MMTKYIHGLLVCGFMSLYGAGIEDNLPPDQVDDYVKQLDAYLAKKEEIRAGHGVSSSYGQDLKKFLMSLGASEQVAEEVINGYKIALHTDIDLDARNNSIPGQFFLRSNFFTELFENFDTMVQASLLQFSIDQNFDQVLQLQYITKFLNADSYQVPDNFYNFVFHLYDQDEINQIHRSLISICRNQRTLVDMINKLKFQNLTNPNYYNFKMYAKDNLLLFDVMRKFLEKNK